jgi:hypothetical protein
MQHRMACSDGGQLCGNALGVVGLVVAESPKELLANKQG